MRPNVILEPTFEQDFEPQKIKQQLTNDVRTAFFLDGSPSLAQAIIDDSPEEFVQLPVMSVEEANGFKTGDLESIATSFSEED